jgi:beta-xylosidase
MSAPILCFLKNTLSFLTLAALCWGCKTPPEQPAYSGNPLFPGWYADPDICLFEGKYWIFPTFSEAFEKQTFLDAFSSADLVNWEKHSYILDTSAIQWAHKAMWAPCVVEYEGQYYLFFGANDLQRPESKWWDPTKHRTDDVGGIGVAVASKPQGPYRDLLGKPLIGEVWKGAQPIDQCVFLDDDGHYYLIYGGWGRCNIARLAPGFTGIVPWPEGEMTREITPEGYVEGPVLFKIRGTYYLMWSEGNWTDGTYQVAYGRSPNLTGPFLKEGNILGNNPDVATGAGHHSVLNIPGTDDWYICYHRRPIPNEGRDHRVVCLERMYFREDGSIAPVTLTFEGVPARPLGR